MAGTRKTLTGPTLKTSALRESKSVEDFNNTEILKNKILLLEYLKLNVTASDSSSGSRQQAGWLRLDFQHWKSEIQPLLTKKLFEKTLLSFMEVHLLFNAGIILGTVCESLAEDSPHPFPIESSVQKIIMSGCNLLIQEKYREIVCSLLQNESSSAQQGFIKLIHPDLVPASIKEILVQKKLYERGKFIPPLETLIWSYVPLELNSMSSVHLLGEWFKMVLNELIELKGHPKELIRTKSIDFLEQLKLIEEQLSTPFVDGNVNSDFYLVLIREWTSFMLNKLTRIPHLNESKSLYQVSQPFSKLQRKLEIFSALGKDLDYTLEWPTPSSEILRPRRDAFR